MFPAAEERKLFQSDKSKCLKTCQGHGCWWQLAVAFTTLVKRYSRSHAGIMSTFLQQNFVFTLYRFHLKWICKKKNWVCTGLTHIFSFTSLFLRCLLDWNRYPHASEAARQAWWFASLRNTGCGLSEAMPPSSGHSRYRTHPCPSWLRRAVIKLRGLTLAELYFSKTISTVANVRHRRRPSLFLSSFHHLPSDSCSKGCNRK